MDTMNHMGLMFAAVMLPATVATAQDVELYAFTKTNNTGFVEAAVKFMQGWRVPSGVTAVQDNGNCASFRRTSCKNACKAADFLARWREAEMDETSRVEVAECMDEARARLTLPFRRPPSRVAGPRRVLTGLRRLVVKTHRLLTWRELTANEEFWAGRVQTALTALIAEGDAVVSDLPDPRDRRRVRKRERP